MRLRFFLSGFRKWIVPVIKHNNCRLCHTRQPKFVSGRPSKENGQLRPYHFLVCAPCLKREKGRIHSNNTAKRVRRKGSPNILYSDWMALLVKENFACTNCGAGGRSNLTLDHRVSLGKGGLNCISNVQLLCRSCHDKKDNVRPDPLRFFKNPYRKLRHWFFVKSGICLPYPSFLKGNYYTK